MLLLGGNAAYVERLDWMTIPGRATATSALENDESDLICVGNADVLPFLYRNKRVMVERLNTFGNTAALCFDTLIPPLGSPALRRATLLTVNQEDCIRAVVGNRPT